MPRTAQNWKLVSELWDAFDAEARERVNRARRNAHRFPNPEDQDRAEKEDEPERTARPDPDDQELATVVRWGAIHGLPTPWQARAHRECYQERREGDLWLHRLGKLVSLVVHRSARAKMLRLGDSPTLIQDENADLDGAIRDVAAFCEAWLADRLRRRSAWRKPNSVPTDTR